MSRMESCAFRPGTTLLVCKECNTSSVSEEEMMRHMVDKHKISSILKAFANVSSYIIEDCETPSTVETPNTVETASQSKESIIDDPMEAKLWPRAFISALITHVKAHNSEFENTRYKKKVWEKIAKLLNEKFSKNYTPTQCDTKWKGLIKNYRDIKTNNATSGKSRKHWEFYDELNELLHKKPEITPVAVCSNSKGLVTPAEKHENGTIVTPDSVLKTDNEPVFESSFHRKRKANENPAERRHRDKMARMDRYLDTFDQLVAKIKRVKEDTPSSDSA